MSQLNEEMKQAIDDYASRIQTLKDFVTAVRKRPGMYIGGLPTALITMIREIFQNSVDQLIDPMSPCNWISTFFDERTREFIVVDNGLGFPFDDIIRILTTQHTSKNYEKNKGEYSSGLNGVGAKVVNALSESFIVESYHYSGKAVRMEFVKGYAKTEKPVSIPNKDKKQGSMIAFIPDSEIIGDSTLEWKSVYKLIKRIMSLTPIGSSMEFEAIDLNGKPYKETIVNKDGILTDLIMKSKHPIIKPIMVAADDGVHKLECAFCYDSGEDDGFNDMDVTSFCNFCPTKLGTHIEGCIEGITRWFTLYMNNIYLSNQKSKDKLKVIAADIKAGLNLMISAAHIDPVFTGQAKEELSNQDMIGFCKEVVMKGLDDWSKSNPQDLSKLSKFFKDIAEIRMKSEASKAKIATKYQTNVLNGLPDKYCKPLGKEHLELLIVEGDSAGGMAKNGRNKLRQGVFPIRGKMPNAFQKSYREIMENAEVQGISAILLDGKPYRRNFDPYKDCKFEKIIIMADADVDGDHIASLLLRLFLLYFPQLIEAGKLYRAAPPLYSINRGGRLTYFTEQVDIVRFIQKNFVQLHNLTRLDGTKLDGKELTVLFLTNADYKYELDRISKTYAMNPLLLEMALMNQYNKDSISSLKKQIKSSYRFMDVTKKNGINIVEGTIDKSYKLYLTDRLMEDCSAIFDIVKKNETTTYMLDGKESSLYEIMSAYKTCEPSSLQRYKGLGEMDVEEIQESTMDPFGNRTLIRYTIDDIKEEIEAIRQYESGLANILDLVGTVNRQDLLD